MLLWLFDRAAVPDSRKLLAVFGVCILTFPCDWSCIAAMAVLFIGSNRGNFRAQMGWMMVWTAVYAAVYFLFIDRIYAIVQLFTCLSIPLLSRYNGQRGRWKPMGTLFYFYYPAHLFLLGILRILLWVAGFVTAAG